MRKRHHHLAVLGLAILLILLVSLVHQNKGPDKSFEILSFEPDLTWQPSSVEDLYEKSDLVVEVEIMGHTIVKPKDSSGHVRWGRSDTQARVVTVYKGDETKDSLTIYETGYLDGETYYTDYDYKRSQVGRSYIFFLTKSEDGYYPAGYAFGKYPVIKSLKSLDQVDALSLNDLDLFDIMREEDVRHYRAWYKAVMAKFDLIQ